MADFVKILVLPTIAFGAVWSWAFGYPLWMGPLACALCIGLFAGIDWMRGKL